MSRTFNPGWKRSYWPEPRFGKKRTRSAAIRELAGAKRGAASEAKAERLRDALAAD